MALPQPRPTSLRQLVFFDLRAGMPTAVAQLRSHLGLKKTLYVLGRFALRKLGEDPLAAVDAGDWPEAKEPLVRHQLRPVLLLDDVLREDLEFDQPTSLAILGDIVRESGARFIEHNVPAVRRGDWTQATPEQRRSFVERLTDRLFNARIDRIETGDDGLVFEVGACRFVQLTAALGRPHLAALFCEADSQFFDHPDTPVFDRPTTRAAGDDSCCFRFSFPDPKR